MTASFRSMSLHHLVRFGNGQAYEEADPSADTYPVLGSGGEFAQSNDYLYDGESVLFGRKGTIDKPLYVNGRFWTVDTMYYTIPGPLVEPKWLYYWATTVPFGLLSTSTALPSMTSAALGRLKVPLPPRGEQCRVAEFLDRETAKIDAMIEKQRDMIAKLKLRRSSTLLRAISGADRDGEKVPSGTSWMGAIPSYWQVGNIRRFATMKTGHTPSRGIPEYWQNTCIPWITLADVWQLRGGRTTYIQDTSEKISELGLQNSAAELLPAGTVVLSRTASIGFSGIMPVPMATSQDYWNWVCGPLLMPEFLLYVFRAMHDEFRALSAGSTHKTIYQGDAASFRIPVPPLAEQREIAAQMDRETARIDALIARSERLIELSQERRSALITAAVTGQLDITTDVKILEGVA